MHGMEWYAWYGMVCMVWYGMHGMAWYAWYGMVYMCHELNNIDVRKNSLIHRN